MQILEEENVEARKKGTPTCIYTVENGDMLFEKGLLLDQIYQSLQIEDVSENLNKLNTSHQIIAKSYSRLCSQAITYQEVYEELCNLKVSQDSSLLITLLITGYNPNTNKIEELGTVSINLGCVQAKQNKILCLEAMDLVYPPEGWNNFKFGDFDLDKAYEICRLGVSPKCIDGVAKEIELPTIVIRKIVIEATKIAQQLYNKSQAWGITGEHIAQRVQSHETQLFPIPKTILNFSKYRDLFHKYDRFWLKSNPRFYKFVTPFSEGILSEHITN
jgi:hypothetical protein